MRKLKTYSKFKESLIIDLEVNLIDIFESMNIWHDVLLTSISAEEQDIFETLNLPREYYSGRLDLDFLSTNIEFINSLSSLSMKKSNLQNTDDFETFLNKPCKFMFIYDINSNELENPLYIMFQVWNSVLSKWDDCKLYKINEDVRRFYDKLSSKTIEILDGDVNYIYTTTNGNEWELQNLDVENDTYKRYFRKVDLQNLIEQRKVKVSII